MKAIQAQQGEKVGDNYRIAFLSNELLFKTSYSYPLSDGSFFCFYFRKKKNGLTEIFGRFLSEKAIEEEKKGPFPKIGELEESEVLYFGQFAIKVFFGFVLYINYGI